ncbi:MAG: flagellar basal body rod protein FlgB [Desulfobulbaceae bacterium]|nr:MAG: flagellar basal body rod protein FlgB [Desulfobulbaceae bacterium]
MISINIFDDTSRLLNKALDLRSSRQQVIASNIANSETPGYSRAEFKFEEALSNALSGEGTFLQATHPQHISFNSPNVNEVRGTLMRHPDTRGIGDENSVSVDAEMIAMTENQLMYETAAKLLQKKLALLKYAVRDGQ